jgi:glycosyltransferase involved in cell wall biosynthesis
MASGRRAALTDPGPIPEGLAPSDADAPDPGRRGRVVFLAPGDVAKGRVEPISWMRTCAAYAAAGFDVTLVTLKVRRPDGISAAVVWSHYGIGPSFRIVEAWTPLGRNPSLLWFRLWAGFIASKTAMRLMVRQLLGAAKPTVVHVRLPILAAPFLILGRFLPSSRRPRVIFETHSMPRPEHDWVLRAANLVVTNSERLAADLLEAFGLRESSVLYAPLPPYNQVVSKPKREAREELGLPAEAQLACYTGKMTNEHNDFLLRTARAVAEAIPKCRLVLVGGNPEVLAWTRRRATELGLDGDRVVLPGFVAPARVSLYQSAADVLVYYMPESVEIFPYCTPAKGYEYQAAGRPIVATDIPLFVEVFGEDGDRALRVPTRTPEALAEAIAVALAREEASTAMAKRAAAWAKERTWDRRTEQVLNALSL